MTEAFFRAGVGAFVFDREGRILLLRRKGVLDGRWQMPQGGIRADETPREAVLRELEEETGLAPANVEIVAATDEWWAYELPPEFRNAKVGWGQVQRWFALRLLAAPSVVRPDEVEFTDAEWVPAEEILERAAPFRVDLYRKVIATFSVARSIPARGR